MSPEIKELSIVLIGKMNPVIANPYWLAHKEFINELEAEQAATKANYINTHEVTQFALSFCTFQILLEQFTATTAQEGHFNHVRDLVSNIFGSLQETPVIKMGINCTFHFRFRDLDSYNAFGDKLAPKEKLWNALSARPGLKNLEIQLPRTDNYSGIINVNVGVSNRIPVNEYGLRININDHYDFGSLQTKTIGAGQVLQVLNENWEPTIQFANATSSEIVRW